MELRAEELSRYFGSVKALDRVSFCLKPGEITGLIGPNGSGKSTLLKILSGRMLPDLGNVFFGNTSVCEYPERCTGQIGFMPDALPVSGNTTVAEHLDFALRLRGVRGDARKREFAEAVRIAGIQNLTDKFLSGLSKGMRQRVSLARLLLRKPEIFLLDEPADGLDPRARTELREILKSLARQGKTVFLSSHILADLDDMCDSVVILEKGRVVNAKAVSPAKSEILFLSFAGPAEKFLPLLTARPGVTDCKQENRTRIRLELEHENPAQFVASLINEDLPVVGFEIAGHTLESIFLHATGKETPL